MIVAALSRNGAVANMLPWFSEPSLISFSGNSEAKFRKKFENFPETPETIDSVARGRASKASAKSRYEHPRRKVFHGIAAGPIRRLKCATLNFERPREDQRGRATEAGERAVVFGLTGPSPGPPVSARQITKSPSTYSQKLCATVLRTISETDRKLTVCRAVFNSAVSLTIYRPLRRKTYCVS